MEGLWKNWTLPHIFFAQLEFSFLGTKSSFPQSNKLIVLPWWKKRPSLYVFVKDKHCVTQVFQGETFVVLSETEYKAST